MYLVEVLKLMEKKYRERISIMKRFLDLCKESKKSYFLQGVQILNYHIAKEYYDKGVRLKNTDQLAKAKGMFGNIERYIVQFRDVAQNSITETFKVLID